LSESSLHATINQTYLAYPVTVGLKCNYGYWLPGNQSVLKCNSTGGWEPSPIPCIPVKCGVPEKVANGITTWSNLTLGSRVTYTCNTGYHLSMSSTERICLENNTWSGEEPICGKHLVLMQQNGRTSLFHTLIDLIHSLSVLVTSSAPHDFTM